MVLRHDELDSPDAMTSASGPHLRMLREASDPARLDGVGDPSRIPVLDRSAAADMVIAAPAGRARPAAPAVLRRHGVRQPTLVLESLLVLAMDCVALATLVVIAGWALAPLAVVAALGAMVTWALAGLYRRRIALSVLDDLPALAVGVMFGLAVAITASSVVGLRVSAGDVVLVGAGCLVLAIAGRGLGYAIVLRERVQGHFARRAVMIAGGSHAQKLGERIADHPESGIRLVGTVADPRSRLTRDLPLLGQPRDLARVLRAFDVTDVVIGYGGMSSADVVEVLRTCDRAGAETFMVPRLFELHTLRRGDDHIWGLPLVRVRRPAQRALTWRVKRGFDIAAAALGLICSAPLMAAIALAVRLELGRGLIFRQTRVGLHGEPFQLLKFRSMGSTPEGSTSAWTPGENSLGPVGRFIRRYSLDELPQLYNVLRGDMSLVGPRPERPEFVEQFSAAVPRYVHRHRVPVGMTGLAAVNGLRGDTSIEERAHFDNWYIDNWSLWLDVKIMVRTLQAVVRGTGG